MSRDLALWLAAAVLVAAVGVMAGRALKGGGPQSFAFETAAPPYAAADTPVGVSRAGFDGFGTRGGLDGRTVVAGRVTAVEPVAITLATSAGPVSVRLTGVEKLRLLTAHSAAVLPGTTVVARLKGQTDEVEALLLLLAP